MTDTRTGGPKTQDLTTTDQIITGETSGSLAELKVYETALS